MKTKFILHGGFQKGKTDENNTAFYSEIIKDIEDDSKILIVPFAKDPDRIVPTTEKVIGEFNKVKDEKNLSFEIASEESFIAQLTSADVVYFQGGTTLKLMGTLNKFQNLKKLIREKKVVAGESAGANALCTLFYSPSANRISTGLRVLRIKIIPHFTDKYKDVFGSKAPYLDELYLKEYEYVVL